VLTESAPVIASPGDRQLRGDAEGRY